MPESTVGQRITRAKQKISQAGIPYHVIFSGNLYDGFRRTMGATPKVGLTTSSK